MTLRYLPVLLATVTIAALPACSIFDNNDAPPINISIASNPSDLQLGDTARITIDVVNSGRDDVSIGIGGCNMDFVITDGAGRTYHPAELVYCILELRAPTELSPGETHRMTGFTTGRVIPAGSQDAPVLLPPGTYGVRAVVWVITGDGVVVRSSPSTITFRARA
jgi:hypothetical protein